MTSDPEALDMRADRLLVELGEAVTASRSLRCALQTRRTRVKNDQSRVQWAKALRA